MPTWKQISKHSTVADNERAHATLREMGIAVHAGFMVNADFTRQDFSICRSICERMPPAQITCTVYTPSPGSQAWHEEKTRYVCHPFDLHDCMHPLTPTALPLREFFTEFAKLSAIGSSRNPLRTNRARFPAARDFPDLAGRERLRRALRRAWRDFHTLNLALGEKAPSVNQRSGAMSRSDREAATARPHACRIRSSSSAAASPGLPAAVTCR